MVVVVFFSKSDLYVHLYIQHMIADAMRFLRQCQRDHMGQYTDC